MQGISVKENTASPVSVFVGLINLQERFSGGGNVIVTTRSNLLAFAKNFGPATVAFVKANWLLPTVREIDTVAAREGAYAFG